MSASDLSLGKRVLTSILPAPKAPTFAERAGDERLARDLHRLMKIGAI
jgi:hypothetical protein